MGKSHNNLTLLLSRYYRNEELFRKSLINHQEYKIESNKIKYALLAFLESGNLPEISAKKNPFEEKIFLFRSNKSPFIRTSHSF